MNDRTKQDNALAHLPNVGRVLHGHLTAIGIRTPEELRALGAKEVFQRIRKLDPGACLHMLYGIQGSIEGMSDKMLSQDTKEELKVFFRSLS